MQKILGNAIRVMERAGLLLFIGCFLLVGIKAEAAGEKARFGSESYGWKLGEACSIGIYVQADQNIESAELYVEYDKEMLEHRQGGEMAEEGLVKVTVSGAGVAEYKEMLQFVPKLSGNTKITVRDTLIRNYAGEEIPAETVSVPVNIAIEEGCALQGIQVNGQAVAGFSPKVTQYAMEVGAETEEAEITVLPADAAVEVSHTSLVPGENLIHIITANGAGQRARYSLNISRPEPPVQEAVKEGEKNIQSEPSVIMEKKGSVIVNRVLMVILIVMLLVILAMLVVIKWQIVQRNRRRRLHGEAKARSAEPTLDEGQPVPFLPGGDLESVEEDVEIAVRNVTMDFRREKDESTSIKELVIRTIRRQRSYEMFRALDHVSFDIRKGEVVGIIGTNGSGKSTILKIISGALDPVEGRVDVDREKIQLLTLGTGFDFELTGRENVYLNGAIIGYTKEYIDEKYDDIVKFAELEGFMEEKVRNYSSGMVSRLGFAIATVSDAPEILILDEVLSVGDMFFRKKSEERIQEMIHGGSTVLIVSHSTSVIQKNCTKAIWIERGVLRMVGDPKEVCTAYENMDTNVT